MDIKGALIICGVCCAAYGCTIGAEVMAAKAAEKLIETTRKRKLNRKEKEDLRKKAEANGWTIVECEYTIEVA